jgi:nitroreductase
MSDVAISLSVCLVVVNQSLGGGWGGDHSTHFVRRVEVAQRRQLDRCHDRVRLRHSVAMDVTQAVTQRISIRQFLDTPVSENELRAILDTARWSPSGGNLQPWRVYALSGDSMAAFKAQVAEQSAQNPFGDKPEFEMYPPGVKEPYRTRRFECGEALYATIGIPRDDKPARLMQMAKNLEFFGAPAAVFLAIDRTMGQGQWAHLGMFMQTIALVAEERGLGTCMQEYWMLRHRLIREFFAIDDELQIYCGIAIGHPDRSHPINTLRTTRAGVDDFATFRS